MFSRKHSENAFSQPVDPAIFERGEKMINFNDLFIVFCTTRLFSCGKRHFEARVERWSLYNECRNDLSREKRKMKILLFFR